MGKIIGIGVHVIVFPDLRSRGEHVVYILDGDVNTLLFAILENEKIIGVLRYNLFWDNTPFCTMLFINSKREYSVFFKAGMNRTNGL